MAAGQNTTFFLAKPNQKVSDLPRHPARLDGVPEACVGCGEDKGDDDSPLECEKVRIVNIRMVSPWCLEKRQCDTPYHLGCLDPPLPTVPEAEWFCPACTAKPGAPIGEVPKPSNSKSSKPSKKKQEASSPEPQEQAGQKRKAASSQKSGGKISLPALLYLVGVDYFVRRI